MPRLSWLLLLVASVSALVPCSQRAQQLVTCLDKLGGLNQEKELSETLTHHGDAEAVCDALLESFGTKLEVLSSVCGDWFPAVAVVHGAQSVPAAHAKFQAQATKFNPQAAGDTCTVTQAIVLQDSAAYPAYSILMGALRNPAQNTTTAYLDGATNVAFGIFLNNVAERADAEAVARLVIAISILLFPVRCDPSISAVMTPQFCALARGTNRLAVAALERLYAVVQYHNEMVMAAQVQAAYENSKAVQQRLCDQGAQLATLETALAAPPALDFNNVTSAMDTQTGVITAAIGTQTAALNSTISDGVAQVLSDIRDQTTTTTSAVDTAKTAMLEAVQQAAVNATVLTMLLTQVSDLLAVVNAQSTSLQALATVVADLQSRVGTLQNSTAVVQKLLITPEGARPGYGMVECMCGEGECAPAGNCSAV